MKSLVDRGYILGVFSILGEIIISREATDGKVEVGKNFFEFFLLLLHLFEELFLLLFEDLALLLDGLHDSVWGTEENPFSIILIAREFMVEFISDVVDSHAEVDFLLQFLDDDTNF